MAYGEMMQKDLDRLLVDLGFNVTFRRPGTGATYDPATGQTTGGSGNSDETTIVAIYEYDEREIDGTNIIRGDRVAVLPGDTTKTPEAGDQIVGEGDTVEIVAVRKIKVGSTIVGYICQVRE